MHDEMMQIFIDMTKEGLAGVEQNLLDIEQAGDAFDLEQLNTVFRIAHSIKGNAGFLGLHAMKELSHDVESALGRMRDRQLLATRENIGCFLSAFDALKTMLSHLETNGNDGGINIAPHCHALHELVQSSLPAKERPLVTTMRELILPDGRLAFSIADYYLRQACKEGNYVYTLEFDLFHDVHKAGKTPFDLMQYLEKSGRILDCRLDMDAAGTLDDGQTSRLPWLVLFATILKPELAKALLQVKAQHMLCVPTDAIHSTAPHEPIHITSCALLTDEKAKTEGDPPPPTPGGQLEESNGVARGAITMTKQQGRAKEMAEGIFLESTTQGATLRISGAATVERAQVLKEAMLEALGGQQALAVDVRDVDAVDVTFIQLLWAMWRTAHARGVDISCQHSPPALKEALALAGMHHAVVSRYGVPTFPCAES